MTIQGAIAELQNLLEVDNVPSYYKGGIEKVIETIQMELADRIEDLPSTDRPTWIPCSERLPEEGEYLVTAKKYAFDSSYYDVQVAYCSPNKKWFHISNCEIVAWMPLPEPWKGAGDE